MSSSASAAMLGSRKAVPSNSFNSSPWSLPIRIKVVSRLSFTSGYGDQRGSLRASRRVCKCIVTTNIIEEKGLPNLSVSVFKGVNQKKDDEVDSILKPSPKPVVKARPNGIVNPQNRAIWTPKSAIRKEKPDSSVEDRERLIESLGEILEKAEKLKAPETFKIGSKDAEDSDNNNGRVSENKSVVKTANPGSSSKQQKVVKSVWRKGNPITTPQKAVKDIPFNEEKEEEKKTSLKVTDKKASPVIDKKSSWVPAGARKSVDLMVSQSKPQIPSSPVKPSPYLNAKPSVDPRPSPAASVKQAPILKDRKPILIDKYAPKKPKVDPVAAILSSPVKPQKGPLPSSKAKDQRRKKANAEGIFRRRLLDDDGVVEEEALAELDVPILGVAEARKGRKWSKVSRKAARLEAAKAAVPVRVEILEVGEEGMLTENLAYNLAVGEAEIFGFLYSKGIKPDTVHTLDKNIVKMVCKHFNVEVLEVEPTRVEEMAKKKEMLDVDDLDKLETRPPVVTVMGHVDHGKTTLLDYICKSKVVASEEGGITQGIGAYSVVAQVDGKPRPCVFLDTPGHEAFGAMRARGARVTDIAVIVVAADDGMRPQTNEAIAHAKAAGVPIIIAINKIDKEGANAERVMQELSLAGLMPEEWGGDVPMVQISALKGENVDELLDTIMLVAELQELKANPQRNAKGTVIEAGLDKAKGPVATLIVQNGTLRKGDVVVCGEAFGKVRALLDDREARVDEAGPSTAVQVVGLSEVLIAGDEFEVVSSLDIARERAEACAELLRISRISAKAGEGKITLSSIASSLSAGKQSGLDLHQLNIILKVDVQGSIEAIRQAIQMLPQENVSLKFLLQVPGDVSISDVDLAVATKAIIFGFNVKSPGAVKKYADNKSVEIRLYRVIYYLIDDIRRAMEGLLDPIEEEVSIGRAEVRATFSFGSGRVAGCMVTDGKVVVSCGLRVLRKGRTIHTGVINSLRRVKEEVKEVLCGLECGIGSNNFSDWEVGDSIQAFNLIKKQRTLEEASASVAAALAGVDL